MLDPIIEGFIEDIIYYNEDNGYTIAVLFSDGDYINIKGVMPMINIGDRIRVKGKETRHPLYGEQLNIDYFEHVKPTEAEDIYKYLSSGAIRGIGESTAHLIVDYFGEKSLEVLQNDPDKLLDIPGIGPKKLETIVQSYREQFELRDFIIYFQNLNLTLQTTMKIYRSLGITAIEQIEENPYLIADKVSGIGFKAADQVALKMGIDSHSPFRIRSAILFLLNRESNQGHCFTYKKQLLNLLKNEIGVNLEEGEAQVSECAIKGDIFLVTEGEEHVQHRIYLASLYYAEQQTAEKLFLLMQSAEPIEMESFEAFIYDYQESKGILLGEKQKFAIEEALSRGLFIITGGPGTGKTTIINAIIEAYERFERSILLAAPTGRAAKRMNEATLREAKTIHRLLEFQGEMQFAKNDSDPLDCDVLIIDEISMVDILLMYRLLDAVSIGTHVIFVGDADQLPSVGPGSVLKDILESRLLPFVKLDEIYRQAEASLITVNAHKINHGELPVLNKADKDFFFIDSRTSAEVKETIKSLITDRLPNYYGFDPKEDIQILSPVKNSDVGVNVLNEMLQEIINPPEKIKKEHQFGNRLLRVGDKVMQIKNNYNLEWETSFGERGSGVFNGDMGYIIKIDTGQKTVTVNYDNERNVLYEFAIVDEIVLAYAITVHKSQGSEFKVVIMPMKQIPPMLMTRNIFYTAITRARDLVVLVGDKQVMVEMIHTDKEILRRSGLKQTLLQYRELIELPNEN